MQKLDVMIARMRLLLADVAARESDANQAIRQCHLQTEKIMSLTLYCAAALDSTLAMMSDVQERRVQCERTLRQLQLVRTRREGEIESLQLTRRVESLRSELVTLQARAEGQEAENPDASPSDVARRIHELQDEINEVSERAARTIGARGNR